MAKTVEVLIPEEQVDARVRELGRTISEAYAGRDLYMICVLKGAVFFACELAKRITVPIQMDFIQVASYGDATISSGEVKICQDIEEPLAGKDVLVVEDIVDTGHTLSYLLSVLAGRGPKSLRVCTLLDKPSRRVVQVPVDYVGFEIPDVYIVGYGLDYAQAYRNLPYVGKLVEME